MIECWYPFHKHYTGEDHKLVCYYMRCVGVPRNDVPSTLSQLLVKISTPFKSLHLLRCAFARVTLGLESILLNTALCVL